MGGIHIIYRHAGCRASPLVSLRNDVKLQSVPPSTVRIVYRRAPEGQRDTCAATSWGEASSGRIQRLRVTSKTSGSPRTHTPEWMHTVGSNVTVMSGVW